MLTQEYLKECLHYDPDTGIFTWLKRPENHFVRRRPMLSWNTRYSGNVVGSKDGKGYLHVSIDTKLYRLHRLAFLYMTGEWPKGEVDHVNHVRTDNRWCNLRDVTLSDNRKNQSLSSRSTTGVTGVYWNRKSEKYCAQIKVNSQVYPLGSHDSLASAAAVREKANQQFNFHVNHGLPKEVSHA